jgi:hypothetical protein
LNISSLEMNLIALLINTKRRTFKFKLKTEKHNFNKSDIIFLVLHLENITGSNIIDHYYDLEHCLLIVNFKSAIQRSLVPVEHRFYSQVITPFEQNSLFYTDNYKLIVYNVPSNLHDNMTVFLKSLIANTSNKIDSYFESKMFPNTFIVTFKKEINFKRIKRRLNDITMLSRDHYQFNIVQAFNTNSIIRRYRSNNEIKIPQIADNCEGFFNSSRFCRRGQYIYELKYLTRNKNGSRNATDKLHQQLILDYHEICYNFDILNSEIGLIGEEQIECFANSYQIVSHFIESNIPAKFFILILFIWKWFHIVIEAFYNKFNFLSIKKDHT